MPNEQQELIAKKIRACLDEAGMTPPELAAIMSIKAPSVYDWLKTGKISKERFPALSALFKKPLAWWHDTDTEEELLNEHERQLLALYRQLPKDDQDKLLQDANWMHTRVEIKPSAANPFPSVPTPNRSKR